MTHGPARVLVGVGIAALVLVFLLALYLASRWPWSSRTDVDNYCLGWRVGYIAGYCAHDTACRVRPPGACPQHIPRRVWWDSSLVAGTRAGEADGMARAGIFDHTDPRDAVGGDYH